MEKNYPQTFPRRGPSPIYNMDQPYPTDPANQGGFLSLLMKPSARAVQDEGVGYLDDGEGFRGPVRGKSVATQEAQDVLDETAKKKAMMNLVNSWQERLQLISVITTFFASVEAGILVNTQPGSVADFNNPVLKGCNASLLGALVMHVYAAVLSFLAAFLLIRYKLKEATREELIAAGVKLVSSPTQGSIRVLTKPDVAKNPNATGNGRSHHGAEEQPTMTHIHGPQPEGQLANDTLQTATALRTESWPVEPPIFSSNPHLELVGILSGDSSHLLSRIHTLCIVLAAVGFLLVILGIMLYTWAAHPLEVSVFVTACLGLAWLAMVTLVI